MKKFVLQKPRWQHLLLLLVGMTFALNASSAEKGCYWSLEVWNTSDDVPVGTFSFSDFQPTVTFEDGQLIVTTQFLDVYLYDLNDVRKLTYLYDDGSGINDVMAEKALMKFNGTDVVFTALEKGTDIMVYAANGMLMMKKNVADAGFSTDWETGEITVSPQVFDDKWAFPYVTAGKTYKVKVEFQNTSYSTVYISPELTVTAASGLGEIYDANNAAYTIQDNKLIFDPLPVLKYGDTVLESRSDWDKYYVMEIYTTNWGWQSWNKIDDLSLPFDFTAENVVKDKDANLMFTLYYVISNDEYGSYRYILYECDSNKSFTLK